MSDIDYHVTDGLRYVEIWERHLGRSGMCRECGDDVALPDDDYCRFCLDDILAPIQHRDPGDETSRP